MKVTMKGKTYESNRDLAGVRPYQKSIKNNIFSVNGTIYMGKKWKKFLI